MLDRENLSYSLASVGFICENLTFPGHTNPGVGLLKISTSYTSLNYVGFRLKEEFLFNSYICKQRKFAKMLLIYFLLKIVFFSVFGISLSNNKYDICIFAS